MSEHGLLRGRRVSRAARCTVELLERRLVLSAILHQGAADPAFEGWQTAMGQSGGATGGLISDPSGDAWRVQELAGLAGASLLYQQTPSQTQLQQALASGWLLSTRIRVPAAAQTAGAISSLYDNGSRKYQMEFSSDAAGDPVVTLPAPAGQAPFSYILQGAGQTYNTYDLLYMPRSAELLVNGQPIAADSGVQGLAPLVEWGAQASQAGGIGDFNLVQFTAFTDVWRGSAGDNNWNNPVNWSTGQVPGPSDNVLIDVPTQPGVPKPTIQIPQNPLGSQAVNSVFCADNLTIDGGTLTVAAPSEVDGTFTVSSGALGGAGNFTITGNLNWSGGAMNGSGKTLLPSGASGVLLGNVSLGREFDNAGTLQFQQGSLMADPATGGFLFDNLPSAQLTLNGVQSIGGSGVPVTFLNGGTLISSGSGVTTFTGPVTNTGSITVNSGTLALNGANTIGGTVTLATGAQFQPASGTLFTGTTLQGNFAFANDSFNVQRGATITAGSSISLNFTKLNFIGDQTLAGSGTVSLTDSSSVIAISPPAAGGSATLTISGGVTVEGQGQITGNLGASVLNEGILIGLLKPFVISVPSFTNTGSIQGQNGGTVGFSGGVFINSGGSADISGNLTANTLTINGGGFSYNGLVDGSVTTLTLSGNSTLGGTGNLVAGTINWGDGSTMSGPGKLTLQQGGNDTFAGNLILGREVDNGGTLTLAGVVLTGGSGGTGALLGNLGGGVINLSGNDTLGSAAAPVSVNNAGNLSLVGQGTVTLNGPFNNTGTTKIGAGTLILNGTNTIGGTVMLASGAQFQPASGTLFTGTTLQGNFAFSNDNFSVQQGATITAGSSVVLNLTKLNFIGDQTLGGSGTVSLADSSSILAVTPPANGGSATLTISGGVTIQGQGQITGNLGTSVLNEGILIGLLKPFVISVPSFTNTGSIQGQNGGTVGFTGGVFINAAGSADISGNLTADTLTLNGGSFSYNGLADGSVRTLTLAGKSALGGAGNLSVAGTINWGDGTSIGGSGKLTLAAGGTGTLGGTLTLDREFDNVGTINSAGFQIGGSGKGVLNNLGGGVFNGTGNHTFGTTAAPLAFFNAGTFTRSGQGTSTFNGAFTSTGSAAINGGTLVLNGANTIGGTVSLATGAQFLPAGGTLFNGATLQGNFGFNNTSLNVKQGLTLGGGSSVSLNLTKLSFIGDQTLGGQGTLLLGDPSSIIAVAQPATGGSATLTINGGVTIQGQGQVTGDLGTSVLNDGILIGLLKPFVISVPSFTNTGSIQGQNGGTVGFTGGVFINNAGTAQITGNLTADSLTINGGTFNYAGFADGSVRTLTLSGTGALGGVGNLVVAATINWGDGTTINGTGKLTLAQGSVGTITGNLTLDRELDNAGTVNLSAVQLNGGSHGTLNNLAGGQFNLSGQNTIGGAAAPDTFNNTGTLTCLGQGTTTFNGSFTSTGTVAINGGTLVLNGANTIGGTVSLATGAQFLPATGTLFNAATLQGNFGFNNASFDVLQGVTLKPGSSVALNFTKLNFIGDQTIGGQGTVLLGDLSSIIAVVPPAAGGSATLTIDGGVTIQGQGTISGGPTSALVNNGTLSGKGKFDVAVPNVTSAGVIAILSGTLQLDGNALIDGGVTISDGALLVLGAGNIVSGPQVLFATGSGVSGGGTVQFQGNSRSQIFGSFAVGATIVQDSASVVFHNSGSSGTLTVNGGTFTCGGANTTTTTARFTAALLPLDTVDVLTKTIITGGDVIVMPGWTMVAAGSGLIFAGSGTVTLSNSDAVPGTLVLGGDLTYNASGPAAVRLTGAGANNGLLDLGGASRTFLINNSSPAGLSLSAWVGDGSVRKSGGGLLTVSGGGSYSGGTTIVDGVVQIQSAAALGTGAITFAGGTLALGPGAVPANTLTVAAADSMNLDVGPNAAQLNIPSLGAAFNLSGGAGGSLTVNSSVALEHDVNLNVSVPLTINGTISGGSGIFKTGAGTVTLGGSTANTFTGQTEVDAGTLVLAKTSGAAIAGNLLVNAPGAARLAAAGQLAPASAVSLDSTIAAVTLDLGGFAATIGPLTISGGHVASLGSASSALTSSGLTITGSKLDLGTSKLLVGYGTGPDPVATVRSYIAGGTLITSAAGLVLGDADSADGVVSGLAANTALVLPTVVGDANLDGKVTFADLVLLAAHYNTASGGTWDHGDFARNGKVNFADLVALAANYGHSAPASAAAQASAAALGRARPRPSGFHLRR